MSFREELESSINRFSMENGSDTPDFVLAEYLGDCLSAFDKAVARRERWYGRTQYNRNAAAPPPGDQGVVFVEPPPSQEQSTLFEDAGFDMNRDDQGGLSDWHERNGLK